MGRPRRKRPEHGRGRFGIGQVDPQEVSDRRILRLLDVEDDDAIAIALETPRDREADVLSAARDQGKLGQDAPP